MIHYYKNFIRRDRNVIILVVIFIILGIAATMLANQCGFIECQ